MIVAPMAVLAAIYVDMRCNRCGLYRERACPRDQPSRERLVPGVHREREMTALVEGTWSTIGVLAFTAAGLSLGAAFAYLLLTWRQDREERTRPEQRGLVSVEESNAEIRRARFGGGARLYGRGDLDRDCPIGGDMSRVPVRA